MAIKAFLQKRGTGAEIARLLGVSEEAVRYHVRARPPARYAARSTRPTGPSAFGAPLLDKVAPTTTARMNGRLVLNGATEIRGSLGEISATHVSLATAIWLQTMVPLTAGDTVELQGYFRVADGYFAADHTSFWGCKVG